jgi:Sigma-54 interaction domain
VFLNCAALPENLVESELFGCKRGAYAGADRDRDGLLRAADKGTLFLDEIAELKPDVQAKLLLVLEGKPYRKLGDTKDEHSDFRLLSATKQDIVALVRNAKFRDDLFYRIKKCTIELPALRNRPDRMAIAKTLATLACGSDPSRFAEIMNAITRLFKEPTPWPGNFRELRDFIQIAAIDPDYAERSKRQEWAQLSTTTSQSASGSTAEPAKVHVSNADALTVPPISQSLEEREQYAALIRGCLPISSTRQTKSKRPTTQTLDAPVDPSEASPDAVNNSQVSLRRAIFRTEKGSRALAALLIDKFPKSVTIEEMQQALGLVDPRPIQDVIAALVRDGLIDYRGNEIAAVWPQAKVSLQRRVKDGWLPVPTDQPIYGKTGEHFRVEVQTRVTRNLIIGIVTHPWTIGTNRQDDVPIPKVIKMMSVDANKTNHVQFELVLPCGCVQVLAHLSPRTHWGARLVDNDDAPSLIPTSALEKVRRSVLQPNNQGGWGNAWMTEFVILQFAHDDAASFV